MAWLMDLFIHNDEIHSLYTIFCCCPLPPHQFCQSGRNTEKTLLSFTFMFVSYSKSSIINKQIHQSSHISLRTLMFTLFPYLLICINEMAADENASSRNFHRLPFFPFPLLFLSPSLPSFYPSPSLTFSLLSFSFKGLVRGEIYSGTFMNYPQIV